MAVRGRGFSQGNDWDPMRDDFDNSNYDPQYADDDASELVHLDHCRLYITNIPKGLNDEGLRAAFAKYGTLHEVYVSKDPVKRYGLVSYETPGEAKLAMMKLNKTEPLKLNISVAHKKRTEKRNDHRERMGRERPTRDRDDDTSNGMRERASNRDEASSVGGRDRRDREDASVTSRGRQTRREDMANGDTNVSMTDLPVDIDEDLGLESLDPELQIELERLQLEHLKLQQQQVQCKQRMLLKQAERRSLTQTAPTNRHVQCVPGEKFKLVVRAEGPADPRDGDSNYTVGAGDSNERDTMCSCKPKKTWDQAGSSSEDDRSTPSTCVLCSEERSVDRRTENREYQDKSDSNSKFKKSDLHSKKSDYSKFTDKTSRKSVNSKTTDLTSKKSDYSKFTDTISKRSASKKLEIVHSRKIVGKHKSDMTCDLKYSDFYSDSEDEADETNRLIQLRNTDYMDIVDDHLKIVIALAGYPKSKMRLRQMQLFQRCLSDVMDMQLKAGLLQKVPSFLDYYLNRGAVVCICRDVDTRDWMVRVSPGLQERMCNNLILLKANVKRLCLAVLKIPKSCWPASAQDAFKLLQYFNPTLKTNLWRIYAQKTVDNVECTSFLIDRVSGEIIRGPSFKNVIDYNQMEFELTGYTEIYYECLLSDLDEISSVASRAKLLEDIKSAAATPRNASTVSVSKHTPRPETEKDKVQEKEESSVKVDHKNEEQKMPDMRKELEKSLEKDILKKLKDVKYISDKDEVIIWSDETNYSDQENDKPSQTKEGEEYLSEKRNNVASTSGVAVSEKTESVIESNDNLIIGRNSNLNIDSNRGIAYHRRTNYLHVENELKIAITLEGYPQNKLEGTHIRRLKHLFKEYLHKDMKNQRFANLIIPKFQDIYLSNGAVIYICDSLETKDYLTEVLPKFINSTGLKLTFRDIKNLVRYTRIVMRLPKEYSHVESVEILLKLQAKYPGLKPDCWKYYSDVAGKQKRQFGVDPESLEVIKSPDFDATYEGDKISFRIIDRQKRDVSFEEPSTSYLDVDLVDNAEAKKLRDSVLKSMYEPIDPEIMNAPLTRIRTNHYSDLIADDLKLFVSPSNYPESRVDEVLFHSIKRTFENIIYESLDKGEVKDDSFPKFHDMYLFDGVIFIICQNMASRRWIEQVLVTVNSRLHIHLKSTEFRGAVGIISMFVKTDKDTDEVISVLQKQNPRLRTKYWRKISTVRTKTKLDVVLQIDKLSAQVITSQSFNKFVGPNVVQFKLGHLQSLLKPKSSLEELGKMHTKKTNKTNSEIKLHETRTKSKVSMQGPKGKSFEELKSDLQKEYPALRMEDWNVVAQREKANHKVCDLEIDNGSAQIIEKEDYKLSMGNEKVFFYTSMPSDRSDLDPIIIEPDSPRSLDETVMLPDENNQQDLRKMILKIPVDLLPDNKDDLNIIFDLLEDKNPGLNTELWQVFTDSPYPNNGKFTLLIDKQSASVVQGKNFDPTIGVSATTIVIFCAQLPSDTTINGEHVWQLNIPGLQRVGSRACIACGAAADAFCARCGVAPYCSTRCQARDWNGRHRAVCHNLARLTTPLDVPDSINPEPLVPPAAPLRRPRSPASQKEQPEKRDQGSNQRNQGHGNQRDAPGNQRERFGNQAERESPRDDGSGTGIKFMPAGHTAFSNTGRGGGGNRYNRTDANDNRANNDNRMNNDNHTNNDYRANNDRSRPPLRHERRNQTNDNEEWGSRAGTGNRYNNRQHDGRGKGRQNKNSRNNEQKYDEEDWETSAKPVSESKPTAVEVTTPVKGTPQPVKQSPQPVKQESVPVPSLCSLADVTPQRKLVPKNCVIDTLKIGDAVVLSVDSVAGECRAASGFVCLSVHEGVEADYQSLCEQYAAACEADTAAYAVTPGETFSYFNPEDGAWYRARCLTPSLAALLDSARLVSLSAGDKCKRLPEKYAAVPEFCCQLQADGVKVGDSLKSTLLAKTANGFKVSLDNVETGCSAGEGELARWLPTVEYPKLGPAVAAPAQPLIPEVPRPDVVTGSTVFLVDATAFDRVFVRPADVASQRRFDAVLQDVVLYGRNASPLTEPPQKGQVVVGKFTDELHYRALVKRTNVKQNKYLLEYIEYGNTHISTLEELYPCPPKLDLSATPTVTSHVVLQAKGDAFTPPAIEYIEKLKDAPEELVLALPSGAKSAPSGSAVVLTVAKSKEAVNKKLEEMCTPEWKKIEERGGDVIEVKPIMYSELQYVDLPTGECALEITDLSGIHAGTVSGHQRGLPYAQHVFTQLTDKIAQYCNSELGREPYLPTTEELCIAQCPPYPQWYRAVVAECPSGPGGPEVRVCYMDYGNVETVPVTLLRKMLPEFVRGLPALSNILEITDFPENPTPEQLQKALLHMEVNEEGRGVLHVTRCQKEDGGLYKVDAPALIAAINKP